MCCETVPAHGEFMTIDMQDIATHACNRRFFTNLFPSLSCFSLSCVVGPENESCELNYFSLLFCVDDFAR